MVPYPTRTEVGLNADENCDLLFFSSFPQKRGAACGTAAGCTDTWLCCTVLAVSCRFSTDGRTTNPTDGVLHGGGGWQHKSLHFRLVRLRCAWRCAYLRWLDCSRCAVYVVLNRGESESVWRVGVWYSVSFTTSLYRSRFEMNTGRHAPEV